MTKARATVSISLADRGIPEHWATDSEAASLSGMSETVFAVKLPALEDAGFPKKSPWNSKRFIPAILAFWAKEHNGAGLPKDAPPVEDEERGKENWGDGEKRHAHG